MLRVIVLSLIYVGSANMFTDSNFKRTIKKAVTDKSRKTEVTNKVNDYNASQAAFEKSLNIKVGEFQVMYDGDNVTQAGMIEYFDEVEDMYTDYYHGLVDQRIEIAGLLNVGEWTALQVRLKKKHSDILRARKKRKQLLEDEIVKVKTAFQSIEKDSSDYLKIEKSVDKIQDAFFDFYEASDNINFVDNNVLNSQSSTKEQVQSVYDQWGKDRVLFYDRLIAETERMSLFLSDEEWDLFIKDLKGKF